MRLRSLLLATCIAAAAALSTPAFAAYPDKPIRMIVPSAPGGAPDVLMRTLCGTGPVGGKVHTPDEWLKLSTMVPRAQAVALTALRFAR